MGKTFLTRVRLGRTVGSAGHGIEVPVEVSEEGVFSAEIDDQTITSDTLISLTYRVKDAILAHRIEIPFFDAEGRAGKMRGFHATTKDILVTWSDGTKDRIKPHAKVFTTLDPATTEEIRQLRAEIAACKARLVEIAADSVEAESLFTEKLGEDLFDWKRHRDEVLT